jgi:hypothetical protein
MKKRIRRRPPDEIKVIVNKKRDDMQNEKKSDVIRKAWERKPYEGCNGKV